MGIFGFGKPSSIVVREDALPGRAQRIPVPSAHHVNGATLEPPFGPGIELAMFGMGCFWGVERIFWKIPGVVSTVVGYSGGWTPNPTYEETCTGRTGHNEIVLVAFDPKIVTYEALLTVFWEGHDPTQGMRQGNDAGTQYRSGIYVFSAEQRSAAEASKVAFQPVLTAARYGDITSEIVDAAPINNGYVVSADVEPSPTFAVFYPAEGYHQQYLSKNPNGYCGIGGTGLSCPVGVARA